MARRKADPDQPDAPRPGPPTRTRRILFLTGLGLALLLVTTAAAASLLYARLDGNIRTDEAAARALAADQASRPKARAPKAQNILLFGSDLESVKDSERSDTTILLHLSADRKSAAAVSVPRDLMVNIPSCLRPDGGRSRAQYAQFNWAFQFGGAACSIRTFENLSGIRVDHHLVVSFTGFQKVIDAVGGVEVDVTEPVREPEYGVTLRPGHQLVKGKEALTFVRTRVGVSDGSDLQRIERQKQFVHSLYDKLGDKGTLSSPTRLWPLLDSVTSALTADPGLESPGELYELASSARSIPAEQVRIVTLPCVEDPDRWGNYQMVKGQGQALLKALREDRPLPDHLYNAYRPDGRPKA
ncbi:LCP family protein [Streptomyces sp. MZ04]|uniref:LCP family protein n=1 Tax=Streptomyces sp. MZ04 TaxID=2559236 RepID=UPI00107EB0C9|nr:LCP family protein [Streptomyces sp. MZ04]TGB06998.1 LytR family transcriptional regulator [Streptomyces sp. MZ04]